MHSPIICFREIIERRGVSPKQSRLLRHNQNGAKEWRKGNEAFGHFASYQSASRDPYNKCDYAFHFIPGLLLDDETYAAMFVGATKVRDKWKYDGSRKACMSIDIAENLSEFNPKVGTLAFDLVWMPEFEDLVERIVIAWGVRSSARAWSQWAYRKDKEVIEIRRDAQEPPFPGFYAFHKALEEIPRLPPSWHEALASVNGVYLLVHPDGEQYVGSAYGEQGFLGRWNEYVKNGHGDNLLLKKRGRVNYAMSVLEVASSTMSESDIVRRENIWKEKLGTRAHGLNAN